MMDRVRRGVAALCSFGAGLLAGLAALIHPDPTNDRARAIGESFTGAADGLDEYEVDLDE